MAVVLRATSAVTRLNSALAISPASVGRAICYVAYTPGVAVLPLSSFPFSGCLLATIMHPHQVTPPRRLLIPAVAFVSLLFVALLFCPSRLPHLRLACHSKGGHATSVGPRPLLNEPAAKSPSDSSSYQRPRAQSGNHPGEGAAGLSSSGASAGADVAGGGARKVQLAVDLAEEKGQRIPDDFYGIFLEVR